MKERVTRKIILATDVGFAGKGRNSSALKILFLNGNTTLAALKK